MISIIVVILVVTTILFIIAFVFKTMHRIQFNLETITIYENINSRLDNVFSLWHHEVGGLQPGNPGNSLRNIVFPTVKLTKNATNNWLETATACILVSFDASVNSISVAIDHKSTETIFSHPYLKDLSFSYDGFRDIAAIFVFQDSKETCFATKASKFTTIN